MIAPGPIADLHRHLDGSLRKETLLELARPLDAPAELERASRITGMTAERIRQVVEHGTRAAFVR